MRQAIGKLYDMIPLKARLFKAVRPHVRLPQRIYRHLHFKGTISVRIDNQHSFLLRHFGHQLENDLFWAGYGQAWEATSLRLWRRLASNAQSIFDIGANTGIYALSAKALNPAARVYAFEPVARIHKCLEENIRLNNFDITAVQAGVSETSGVATLYDTATEHQYSASLDQTMLAGRDDVVEYKVRTYCVSDFLNECSEDRVDLVKIDTERHEEAVLRGFGETIASKTPVLLIEILDRSLGKSLESFVSKGIYRFYEIHEGLGANLVESLGGNDGGRNYLICPHHVAEQNDFGDHILHENL